MADEDKEKKVIRYSRISLVVKSKKDKENNPPNVNEGKTISPSNLVLKSSRSNMALAKTYNRSNMVLEKSYSRMKMRKQSYGFGAVPGIKALDKAYKMTTEYKRPALIFLPTYQLGPRVKFHHQKVMDVAEAVLDNLFTGHDYNITASPALALRIAADVMRYVKYMEFNRYRIISVVTIGQKRAQSYNNAVTFLWDYERDTYVDVHRENNSCFVQVTLFGVYLD